MWLSRRIAYCRQPTRAPERVRDSSLGEPRASSTPPTSPPTPSLCLSSRERGDLLCDDHGSHSVRLGNRVARAKNGEGAAIQHTNVRMAVPGRRGQHVLGFQTMLIADHIFSVRRCCASSRQLLGNEMQINLIKTLQLRGQRSKTDVTRANPIRN